MQPIRIQEDPANPGYVIVLPPEAVISLGQDPDVLFVNNSNLEVSILFPNELVKFLSGPTLDPDGEFHLGLNPAAKTTTDSPIVYEYKVLPSLGDSPRMIIRP